MKVIRTQAALRTVLGLAAKPRRYALRRDAVVRKTQVLLLAGLMCLAVGGKCGHPPAEPQFDIENISNSNPSTSHRPSIACDNEGRVALAWSDYVSGYEEIWLVEKERGGQWTEPFNLSQSNDNASRGVKLVFDSDGTLHVVWSQGFSRGISRGWAIVYTWRPFGGEWAVPETVYKGVATKPGIAVDASGTVHLQLLDMSAGSTSRWTSSYASRSPAGEWSPVQELSAPNTAGDHGLAAFDDGTVVAAWDDWSSYPVKIMWTERARSGDWTTPALAYLSPNFCQYPIFACNGTEATLAFSDAGRGQIVVLTRPVNGPWSKPDTSCETRIAGSRSVAMNRQGHVFLGFGNAAEPALRVARRDSVWTQVKITDSLFPGTTTLAVDEGGGRIHLAWRSQPTHPEGGDIYYVEIPISAFVQ